MALPINKIPTEEEHQVIDQFCRRLLDDRCVQAALRAEKKVLRIERSEIEPQILAYMRSKSLTCVPVSVEQKPLYLRVRESNAIRTSAASLHRRCNGVANINVTIDNVLEVRVAGVLDSSTNTLLLLHTLERSLLVRRLAVPVRSKRSRAPIDLKNHKY